MVFEIIYSTGRDKFKENLEERKAEERFSASSDYLIPEEETENYKNKNNSNLSVVGGKIYESKVKKNISNIIRKTIETKSF